MGEDQVNKDLAKNLPVKMKVTTYDLASTKALLLLYAHFSRTQLPSTDYATDTKSVLDQAIRVLQAFVDASADRGWVVTSLRCMHVIQMVTQASWYGDTDLMTLPCVERDDLNFLQSLRVRGKSPSLCILTEAVRSEKGAKDIAEKLGKHFNQGQLQKIMLHLQKLPVVKVQLSLEQQRSDDVDDSTDDRKKTPTSTRVPFTYGTSMLKKDTWVKVKCDQEYNLRVNMQRIHSQIRKTDDKSLSAKFPKPKLEGWFLVLCDRDTKELCALKRVSTLRDRSNESIVFNTPVAANTKQILTLFLVSDSYIGLDQMYDVRIETTL